ncbi:MAG: hypothetical protein CL862_00395 [Cyanobium sp. NAT70]|nr:hypothetical protein [Cyanobium sp. NAT70]
MAPAAVAPHVPRAGRAAGAHDLRRVPRSRHAHRALRGRARHVPALLRGDARRADLRHLPRPAARRLHGRRRPAAHAEARVPHALPDV